MEAGSGDGGAGGNGGGDGGAGTGAGAPDAGAGGGSDDDGDEQLGEGGKKALQAERDANKSLKSENATLSQRVKELEDAGKSTEDREKDRVSQLEKSDREKEATIAQRDATILRYQVAAAKGLDLEAAERLRGGTKEEIEADADAWIKKWGSSRDVKEVPGAGAGDSGGATDSAPGQARIRNAYENSSK
jgi:hypothetical protein